MPDDCPRCRRPFEPGRVLVGWAPCMACPATATAQRGLRGHRTLQCMFCHDEGVEAVRYDPPCVHKGGHPNRQGRHSSR